jgi:hypothetical protein
VDSSKFPYSQNAQQQLGAGENIFHNEQSVKNYVDMMTKLNPTIDIGGLLTILNSAQHRADQKYPLPVPMPFYPYGGPNDKAN